MSLGFGETVQALTPDPKYFTLTNSNGLSATSYLGSVRQTLSFKVSGLGLSKVALSGSFTDLLGVPSFAQVAYTGSYASLSGLPTLFDGTWGSLTGKPTFAAVALSGAYGDLIGLPTLFNGAYSSLTGTPTFATVATSGRYSDLVGLPTLFNGAYTSLTGTPTFATVATSGQYADLLGKPVLFSGSYTDLSNKPTLFSGAYSSLTGTPTLATVATTGSYTDLSNKPTLFNGAYSSLTGTPALATVATTGSYTDLSNKPILFNGAYSSLTGMPTFATVATSGSYADLSNKPILFNGAYTSLTGTPTFATVATSGKYSDLVGLPSLFNGAYTSLTGTPTLATVATTGSYTDLSNKPTIPSPQIQSDWTQTTTTALDYIKNKPTLFSGAYADLTGTPTIPATQLQSDWNQTTTTALDYIKNKPSGLTNTGSAGTGTWSLQVQTGDGLTSQVADIAFFSTFNNYPADKGQRRTADITAGFASGVWGNEYLAFGVGSNDSKPVSTERMRISGNGNVGIGTKSPNCPLHIYKGGSGGSESLMGEIRVCSDDGNIARVGCYEESGGTTWGGWFQYNGANAQEGVDQLQIGGKRNGTDVSYINLGAIMGMLVLDTDPRQHTSWLSMVTSWFKLQTQGLLEKQYDRLKTAQARTQVCVSLHLGRTTSQVWFSSWRLIQHRRNTARVGCTSITTTQEVKGTLEVSRSTRKMRVSTLLHRVNRRRRSITMELCCQLQGRVEDT